MFCDSQAITIVSMILRSLFFERFEKAELTNMLKLPGSKVYIFKITK